MDYSYINQLILNSHQAYRGIGSIHEASRVGCDHITAKVSNCIDKLNFITVDLVNVKNDI